MQKRLIIMRGLPGSGKSTFALCKFPGAIRCSADNWFMVNGVYKFDPSKLGEAHANCQVDAFLAMGTNMSLVVIDNTNIQAWESLLYVTMGKALGYSVEAVWVKASLETCLRRNVHAVPEHDIEEMIMNFEEDIGIPQTIVENSDG